MKEHVLLLLESLNHLMQSFILRYWFMVRAILNPAQVSCKVSLLIFPVCVLVGLINLYAGLERKSLLWSFKVIKQFSH